MGRGDGLTDICTRHLSHKDEREKVEKVVQRCVDKGYDYEEMRVGFNSLNQLQELLTCELFVVSNIFFTGFVYSLCTFSCRLARNFV